MKNKSKFNHKNNITSLQISLGKKIKIIERYNNIILKNKVRVKPFILTHLLIHLYIKEYLLDL